MAREYTSVDDDSSEDVKKVNKILSLPAIFLNNTYCLKCLTQG